MKKYYDEYGIASDDLDAVAKVISERLDVPLEADSDSDYGGRFYAWHSDEDWVVRLFLNWNPIFEDWVKWRLRGHTMVLQVFESPRAFEIEKTLRSIKEFDVTLLDRGVYDTETEEFKELFSAVDQRQDAS